LGVNDELQIVVPGHPEFTVTRYATATERPIGQLVKADGKIYLPMVGGVAAEGRTVLELQEDINERLRKYLKEPHASVDVVTYASQRFYVLGGVNAPGVFFVDGRRTLLEGIGLAQGIRDESDIEGAYVVRGRTLLPISLGDLLLRGDTSRNIVMRHGDLVYVPPELEQQVYVLGEVRTPGVVPVPRRRGLSLAQAVASAGGLDPLYASKKEIRVFRGGWQAPTSFHLTADDLYEYGEAIRLHPGDRVVVAESGLATWNRAVTLMLPFLDTVIAASLAAAAFG
jgi:polysaccharide export outer membrane protein